MSRRNFILLIIILVIATIVLFGFLYFRKSSTPNPTNNGTNFLSNFNPFGSSGNNSNGGGGTPSDVSQDNGSGVVDSNSKLLQVSKYPVAGYTVYRKEREKGVFIPALRYVDRKTGNIFQTYADQIEEQTATNTVVPKIYEAFFTSLGKNVFMRYLKSDQKTIETFGGVLPADSTSLELKSSFLEDNISDMSVAPDDSKIFYLLNGDDVATGIIYDPATGKKSQIFDSPFTEWLSFWPNLKLITLTTKPSGLALGYMYAINPDKKDFNKILGDINGLTTLTSPNGKLVLYSDNTLALNLFNTETKTTLSLGVRTLPEKCVWNSSSTTIYCAVPQSITPAVYPDSWYQGETAFVDQIEKIDVASGNSTTIMDPAQLIKGLQIDGTKLQVDPSETYLFFVNKQDSLLFRATLN